ncbi:hypothetical protein Salat_1290300 [Sesamum alatum]|uniref:Reverse transcriptase zinc-binding domain-containing protein n=1 Tax=Sesamum alatum TaxID=300844 RepID=A0AAE1YGR3_9LAMI|nr:hypothetical protein Salat_1290300 [Sesamum alatum]
MPDRLGWHFSATWDFSVWSAYNLATTVENREILAGPSDVGESLRNNWNFVWRIKLPNKVKVFLCRLYKQIIPTSINLRRHHVPVTGGCSRCADVDEDDMHVMLDCSFSRQVWALSKYTMAYNQWMGWISRNLDSGTFSKPGIMGI